MREDGDANPVHTDDVGAGIGSDARSNRFGEGLVVVWNQDPASKDTEKEEQSEAEQDCLDSARDGTTRADGFASTLTDKFGSTNRVSGDLEHVPEAKKAAKGSGRVVLGPDSGVFPVAEADAVVMRITTEHDDKGHEDDGQDEDDLDGSGQVCTAGISNSP